MVMTTVINTKEEKRKNEERMTKYLHSNSFWEMMYSTAMSLASLLFES